jgi:hypothetical protein
MRSVEAALADWREAQRRLERATDPEREAIKAEVEEHRQRLQELSAAFMVERIDALREAEARRKTETPSTPAFHEAARDEMEIATDIWGMAHVSDASTPAGRTDGPDEGDRGSV